MVRHVQLFSSGKRGQTNHRGFKGAFRRKTIMVISIVHAGFPRKQFGILPMP
jgi:hypothetical protein